MRSRRWCGVVRFGSEFCHVADGLIVFLRGYWDKLSFLRQHGLPIPQR